jgi:CRP-like cAMP-binding protein
MSRPLGACMRTSGSLFTPSRATEDVIDICTLLSTTSLFSALEAATVQRLADRCHMETYPAGTTLFVAGDPGDEMFVVVKGSVKVLVASEDGDITLATFSRGDTFGEMSLLEVDGRRTATAVTVEPSDLLVVARHDFDTILRPSPDFLYRLLREVSMRLSQTNQLLSPQASIDVYDRTSRAHQEALGHDVTLVGYGRYGRLHIGPKYATNSTLWNIAAIVDPLLTRPQYRVSRLGLTRPDVPIFATFDDWRHEYFDKLDDAAKAKHVVDIALRPDIVCEQALLYLRAGIKNMILPKPVTVNHEQFDQLSEEVAKHNVKAAVASQWHYSDLPRLIRREIKRLVGQPHERLTDVRLHRVELEFSKENGAAISATPPLSELPHAMQLLESIGLVDLAQHQPAVSGDEDCVEVVYRPTNITEGIHVRASLDWTPNEQIKLQYPHWDVQNRSLKVYLHQDHIDPSISVDFWVKFDRTGRFAIRPGKLTITETSSSDNNCIPIDYVDDQLMNMLCKIYAAFDQERHEFQIDERVMPLDRYANVGKQLMLIEKIWQEAIRR